MPKTVPKRLLNIPRFLSSSKYETGMDCTSLAFNTQDTLPACSCYIQMRHFVRIGHILEDDVEHMHMISAHFEAVVS